MASSALEQISPGLAPSRGIAGPVTRLRQRRTKLVYAAMCIAGALPTLLDASPGLRAAGLGLWIPGGGFVALGGWWMLGFPIILLLFVASLVAWFWAGMVVAPVAVWLGAAAAAGFLAGDAVWSGAPVVVALAAAGVGTGFVLRNRKAAIAGAAKAAARASFLPQSLAEVADMARCEPDPEHRELSAGQLAGLRYLLDRALQPVDSFDGFTIIDQFQPAALRYQINHMGFALAIAQGAYVPNFRGYMGLAQRNLIEKYLERKVWSYWVFESCWGHLNFTDWNPAGRDNIMLTGWFGAHVGQYMLATGDRRYMEPGSLTFRLSDSKVWRHDFRTIVNSVKENYEAAEFGLYACEPNWIYPICNHYGMLALVTHDALTGSNLVGRFLPNWVDKLDAEFIDSAGSIIGLRSQLTGLPVPFPVGEATYSHFANCFVPGRARQLWAIARKEAEPLLKEDAAGLRLEMPGEGLDPGHYKPGHLPAYADYMIAAREFGDTRIADACERAMERDCMPQETDGVRRFLKGSNLSNATSVLARIMDTGDFRRSFTAGPSARTLAGPMIETLEYPEVLVARAWSDGEALEAVFLPGTSPGRRTIPVSQLQPGRRYALDGAVEQEIVAGADGTAAFTLDLSGRVEVSLRPA